MKWSNSFWTASTWVIDTTIHAVSDTLTTCGSLASTAGGAGFAISYVLAEQKVSASYYGSGRAAGDLNLGVEFTHIDYNVNASIPFDYGQQLSGGSSYNLTDYVSPETVRTASYICVASGMVLRTVGANLKKWQQSREEKRYQETENRITLTGPSRKEYMLVGFEAMSGALSTAMLSSSVTGAVFYFSGVIGLNPSFTYPPYAEEHVLGPDYSGPVRLISFPMTLPLGTSNITITLPIGQMNLLVKKAVDAVANVTYGGGIFFKSNVTAIPAIGALEATTTTIGASAYLVSGFFSKSARRVRDERIRLEERRAYTAIETMC